MNYHISLVYLGLPARTVDKCKSALCPDLVHGCRSLRNFFFLIHLHMFLQSMQPPQRNPLDPGPRAKWAVWPV